MFQYSVLSAFFSFQIFFRFLFSKKSHVVGMDVSILKFWISFDFIFSIFPN